MKKNEFIIIFGLILLGFSVYQISNTIVNYFWFIHAGIPSNWNIVNSVHIVWVILAPIVVLGIGVAVRFKEK